ncbi:carbohydrate ABC transporter permease [bacterium]|nr:MAG: carbohydrate ABC transporter permease [bacterium]
MSLVGRVGRKRPRARLAMAGVYLALVIGAITTLYPFALMVSTGLKGPTDQNDNKLVPAYLREGAELSAKYLDDKYAGDKTMIASTRVGADAPALEVHRYEKFLMELPMEFWTAGFKTAPGQVTGRLQIRYQSWLRNRFRGDIEALNRTYTEEAVGFQTVVPPPELLERKTWAPSDTRKFKDWLEFKRSLPAEFRIPIRETRLWQEWVRGQAQNQIKGVPPEYLGVATSFETLSLPDGDSTWFQRFIKAAVPARYSEGAAESRWYRSASADVRKRRYAFHMAPWLFASTDEPRLPIVAFEKTHVARHAAEIRSEFSRRNFSYVLDYILINGRAVFNTFAFCALAVLTQLIVNPLAAYALSRYPVKQSGKILIFLLATMAFPAEVAMIPSFLLLRDLGLLNTFAALVLPVAASGYMIFLLKGFFDSLPQELFEAGSLDGAPETVMMTRIALPLSLPVMGYLALVAFMGAYGSFLYAFLVIQDQRMWTLMVWVYQLQNTAPRAVMMAALTLAALPTLLVFLMAQKAIVRGIVLPGER